MKHVVMTTQTEETVTMGDAGQFRTGVPVAVEDDALASALLKRHYPKFEQAHKEELPAIPDKPEKKKGL